MWRRSIAAVIVVVCAALLCSCGGDDDELRPKPDTPRNPPGQEDGSGSGYQPGAPPDDSEKPAPDAP
ncbi:MAG: hypothetical protein ACYSU7_03330 [Planctomycetota bacterium]|jgi:hypothetical protein